MFQFCSIAPCNKDGAGIVMGNNSIGGVLPADGFPSVSRKPPEKAPENPDKSLTSPRLTSLASVAFGRRHLPLNRLYQLPSNWIAAAIALELLKCFGTARSEQEPERIR
jgi:hypothetical protein